MLAAMVVATVFVTIAELGDKTQLLVLSLAARYSARTVLIGVFAAVVLLQLIATAAGRLVGGIIPQEALRIVTGLLFIGFGVFTLRNAGDAGDEERAKAPSRFGPVLATFTAFFIAELGDKTQIVAMTVAADPAAAAVSLGPLARALPTPSGGADAFFGVWIGAVLGMLIADGVAIGLGSYLGRRLPAKLVMRVSGAIFVGFGLVSLGSALLGE